VDEPSLLQKLVYLGGRRAPDDHRHWVAAVLDAEERRRGLLLVLPNVLVMSLFALLSLLVSDPGFALILAIGAGAIVVAAATIPGVSSRRARLIVRKNGLPPA